MSNSQGLTLAMFDQSVYNIKEPWERLLCKWLRMFSNRSYTALWWGMELSFCHTVIKQTNLAFCKQTPSALQRKTRLANKQKAMCKYKGQLERKCSVVTNMYCVLQI